MTLRSLSQGILGLILLALAVPALAQAPSKPDIIEIIEITGEINQFTANAVKAAVEKVNETPKVKGVLLVVNSPGGGATASANLYSELGKIKAPVVGFCDSLCASGGVYALMAPSVKYIAVREGAVAGSVGVIAQLTRYNRLLEWAKIDSETYVSGPLKDTGNPTRAASENDRKAIQGLVNELASRFYAVVQKSRPKANMTELKTAAVFIGDEAVRVGLADKVMTYEEALTKVKELSGSKNAYTRDELRKITKDASEAAGMNGGYGGQGPRTDGAGDSITRALNHADTVMATLQEIRSGASVRFLYRMPYQF